MCIGSKPKAPSPPPRAPETPRLPDIESSISSQDAKRRSLMGRAGTILTSSQGLTSTANVAQKTLLGA